MLRGRVLAALCCAAVAAGAWVPPQAAAQKDALRVGFLTVRTGPLAAGGKQMEEGITLFLKERNYTLTGRKVELTIADTAGNPAQTKTKTQELVEKNRVHVIIGPLAAFEAIAINDYIRETRTPIISCSAAAEDLTQRRLNPWFVRAVATSAQPNHALGEYAARDLKLRRVVIIADDFAYGHETAAGFQRTFEENGGKVVQKVWTPLNAPDYGAYIAQIKGGVDAVYAGFAGANGFRFLKQYATYGLKMTVLGSATTVDEGILKNMGEEAVGVYSTAWYAATIDSVENRRFVAEVNKAYGADPGYYTVGAYSSGLMLEAALKAVDGRIEDRDAFMKALRTVRINNDPRGVLKLDAYGNPVQNIYIRKVERKGGKLVNSVVKVYPDVSQFWSYRPEEFLKNPVYSRDWPPSRNLE
jgi:branched-chain amino acid transport system substrate-binding protein